MCPLDSGQRSEGECRLPSGLRWPILKTIKPCSTVLLLGPCLALSAWSQINPLPPIQPPLSQVKQFLGLTDAQLTAIIQNNSDYNTFSFQQQRLIFRAQTQIAVETARDPLDPM